MWNLFWDAHHFGFLRKLKTKWLPWIHVVTDHHCLKMNILNTQNACLIPMSMRLLFIHVHTQDPPTPLLPKTCRFLYKLTWHVHFKRIWILMFIHTQCPNLKAFNTSTQLVCSNEHTTQHWLIVHTTICIIYMPTRVSILASEYPGMTWSNTRYILLHTSFNVRCIVYTCLIPARDINNWTQLDRHKIENKLKTPIGSCDAHQASILLPDSTSSELWTFDLPTGFLKCLITTTFTLAGTKI